MGALEVHDLTKQLGDTRAVDGVSFRVEEGEFFVLLGTSGSGKSTLLRLICGLEQPDSGRVTINGRDATLLPPRERHLGMVFQDYGLYPNMNVYQNIAYGLEARGMPRKEIETRVVDAADKLGLSEMLKRSIVDLSGGEQQRVALARALAKDAEAFLFDEPLSNLDPKLRYQARRDIMALHRAKRKPSLYVTHDQAEAFAMGDRIAVMAKGQLQQIGRTEDLVNSPANVFVAGFIGAPPMNVVQGMLKRDEHGYQVMADGFMLKLPDQWNTALTRYNQNTIIIGLRPEALVAQGHTATWADVSQDHVFSGTVVHVEPLLGETVVTLKLGSGTRLVGMFEDDGDDLPTAGQTLRIVMLTDHLCLFDPTTQQALKMV